MNIKLNLSKEVIHTFKKMYENNLNIEEFPICLFDNKHIFDKAFILFIMHRIDKYGYFKIKLL
jgi:hypothetical protein